MKSPSSAPSQLSLLDDPNPRSNEEALARSARAQLSLLDEAARATASGAGGKPFKTQLLKWIGNKQRYAPYIIGLFPDTFGTYYEPFIGSGAVLGTLAPRKAVASDVLKPLIEIWEAVAHDPEKVKGWYRQRWEKASSLEKVEGFEHIKASYNARPNGADLLYICRTCYGGVVRFRQRDGYISTPCGVHVPMKPDTFSRRVDIWHARVKHTTFQHADFESTMDDARKGDVVYCDPPYVHAQTILYGAQRFSLQRLFGAIERCKSRGVRVLLSIDRSKRSGDYLCNIQIPPGLFEREVEVNCGRSMLRRFQMKDETLEGEQVSDRLLLTF